MSLSKKVLVIGAFGYREGHIGGQTDKIRLIYQEVKKSVQSKVVSAVDTSEWKRKPVSLTVRLIAEYRNSSHIIFMPGKNGLKLLPLLVFLKRKDQRLFYIVIGGWLPSVIEKNRKLLDKLSILDTIFAATEKMRDDIASFGLSNVSHLPNFRRFPLTSGDSALFKISQTVKLVFFSRVSETKGVSFAIKTISRFNTRSEKKVSLDIYGPIQKGFEDEFLSLVGLNGKNIRYLGCLDPKRAETYEVLGDYDAMLFPTFYQGEGFPGVIIDSFAAGIPVLASDWRYNSEVVEEGRTGLIFETNNEESLIEKLNWCSKNLDRLREMRVSCRKEAEKYHADNVIPKFLSDIGLV